MNNKVINEKLILDPIGTNITIDKGDINYLFPDVHKVIKVELYCPVCKEKRVFKCDDSHNTGYYLNRLGSDRERGIFQEKNELLIYNFSCEFNHKFKMIFETLGNGELIKVGQYPWPRYFSQKINDDIFKILDDNERTYYMLSIKSQDNNLNIASFVYLRRVFESLIAKAIKKSSTDFTGKKVKEQIKQLVKEGLLNEILNNTGYNVLYTLLSDGIHNLTEEQCKEQFDLLKSAIEIILEDEIYKRSLEKRKISIGNLLSNKNSEVKE